MKVLLLQMDGKTPNLALMRIAAHHRGCGDEVELRHARSNVERNLWDGPAACRFCVLGAIRRIHRVEYQQQLAITRLEKAAGTWNLPAWNDGSSHAEVIAAVKAAGI